MSTTGYIINGVYHKGKDILPEQDGQSITYKGYDHDKQRQEHRRELIQPYVSGEPNPEFIAQFPAEAKEYGFI